METKKILFFATGFVVLYNFLFYNTIAGLGLGFLLLAVNTFFFLVKTEDSRNLPLGYVASALSVLFAFLFSFRANEVVEVLNFGAAFVFALLALFFYKLPSGFSYKIPSLLFAPPRLLGESVTGFFRFARGGVVGSSLDKDSWSALARGFLIAAPIFAVLFFLLGRADPIFAKLTGNLVSTSGERFIVSFIIFSALTGFGFAKVLERLKVEQEGVPAGKAHELAVITGSIIVLFAAFILVQFRYLFSSVGERELGELGITSLTYSEYVRRGFFELLAASVLATSVVLYTLRFLHSLQNKQKKLIQAFSAVLTVETGLLLFSAAQRLSLYSDAHGLTRARIFGFIFLVWLAVMLVVFLIRILQEMRARQLFSWSLTPTVAALLFVNLVNVDGLIATTFKPTVNNEIDYFYIASLSEDAYKGWEEALLDSARIIESIEAKENFTPEDSRKLFWAKLTLGELERHANSLLEKYDKGWRWQEYHSAKYEAYKEIKKDAFYKKVRELLIRASALDMRFPIEIKQQTPIDRSTNPPLVR